MSKLFKFGFIGIINTAITIVSYAFLVYAVRMNFLLANIIAYILGMINSYIWNKNWVFQVKENNISIYIKFITVNLVMLGFNSLGLYILASIFNLNKLISQIIVVGLGLFINFILTKTWTFAPKRADSKS
ncbi:GtrA family protein [Bacillus sp. EB600]|uniref:GtrA family protein n=1 Tax=Bacillus sp. EB600 TaxID=2806345 RepID=UPI00210D65F9|nr:GtrA family protein [Bacillus sp. EB600]MCQ6278667.1 GtrA family protein [Bacillus sp. EB600]